MFRLLNVSGTGVISRSEFYNVYDALCLKWREREEEPFWFHRIRYRNVAAVIEQVHRLVTWRFFDYFVGELLKIRVTLS